MSLMRAEIVANPAYEPSEAQKLALMQFWNTKLAMKVREAMLRNGARMPSQHDFLALRQAGFTERKTIGALDRLTSLGRVIAQQIAFDLGRQYRIHTIHYIEQNNGVLARCPCGWSLFGHKARTGYATYVSRWASEHIEKPAPMFCYGAGK